MPQKKLNPQPIQRPGVQEVSSSGPDIPNPVSRLKPENEARVAIAAARAAMPGLTWSGFDAGRCTFNPERVATAIAFLRSETATLRRPENSGWLKHLAERWGRDNGLSSYVSNGELIVAAIYLGFSIREIPETPNAMIGGRQSTRSQS